MTLIRFHKLLEYFIHLLCSLLIVLPINKVYMPYEFDPVWENRYIYNDSELTLFLVPILVLWFVSLIIKQNLTRRAAKVLLLLILLLNSIMVIGNLTFSIDLIPYFGSYIILLLMIIIPIHMGVNRYISRT